MSSESSGSPLEAYFDEQETKYNVQLVRGTPRFDLEAYISNYSGRTQIDRLFHIAKHCPPLAIEALTLAIAKLKTTYDLPRYRHAVSLLSTLSPSHPDAVLDSEFLANTDRHIAARTEKITEELASYKHNLIKESIRMGHDDMGRHQYACGNLNEAFKSFTRMRDYCTLPKHVLDMSMAVIGVCVEQGNWMAVLSNATKVRNVAITTEEEEAVRPKICAVTGLAHLAQGAYRAATASFLETPPSLANTYNEVISSNDVAIYGGLCALASMERAQLKSEVLDNQDFRQFLELEPQMRKAIAHFYTAKYSECLEILEAYKGDWLLDLHLHRHVEKLYEMIRSKGIVQYFIPFSCVTLGAMAAAFRTTEPQLEQELVGMIGKGLLKARIDTKNRLLTAKESDLRASIHRDALTMAQDYERAARLKLLRMNMVRAGLDVRTRAAGPADPSIPAAGFPRAAHAGFMDRFAL